jgi:hypothetical protein
MRTWTMTVTAGVLVIAAALAAAQPPGGQGPAGTDDLVTRMMAFDQDKDGKLTRAEVTDARLHPLFDRADADKDGTVTGPELNVLMVQERAKDRGGPPGFGPRGGGPGGPGGPPAIGQVLPGFLQDRLNLTAAQKEQVAELQKEVDSKLANILTDEQKKTLQEMRERGPGRGGPPGGRPGGPGGPPGGPGGRPGGPPPGEQP